MSEDQEKSAGGRPSGYRDEYAKQAAKLCELGATDREIADFFEVDVRTIYRWKHDHDGFCHSLKTGKDVADERVSRSLYQRAIGYEQEAVKIFMPAGAAEPVYAPYTERIAPDTTAAIFWLKNRRPDLWRDKTETEHSGTVGHVIDTAKLTDEQLAALASIPMADQK
jgi:hypothetical protein